MTHLSIRLVKVTLEPKMNSSRRREGFQKLGVESDDARSTVTKQPDAGLTTLGPQLSVKPLRKLMTAHEGEMNMIGRIIRCKASGWRV